MMRELLSFEMISTMNDILYINECNYFYLFTYLSLYVERKPVIAKSSTIFFTFNHMQYTIRLQNG